MTSSSLAEKNHQVLQDILEQLKELNETVSLFTSEGFPLKNQVPTSQHTAAIMIAAALLGRTDPRITQADLKARLEASPVIAYELCKAIDSFMATTQSKRLDNHPVL